jgi:DHA1 family multidrug resistance protein-like MFS transporter
LIITSITLFLASETTQPILPLYITQKGATTLQLGIIISLLSFTTIAAKIPLGILAEKAGRWPIIPAVAIGQTTSLLLYSFAPDPTWFYPIRIFHALILAAFAPTALSITQDLAPPSKRATTIGTYLISIGVASTIGPFLCTFLVNYVDYARVFQIASVIPLIGLAPFLLIRPKSHPTPDSTKTNPSLLTSFKAIFSSRNMLILTYLRLTFSFTYAFFITLFAVYAENTLLLLPVLIALLFGIRGLTNMLSRIPSGRIADKIGYKIPIILAFTLLTITFLTISQTDNIYFLILAMIIYGAAHGIRAVSEWSMLGDYAPSEAGTVATAYLSTMFSVGAALGAVAAGALTLILDTQTIFKLASIITLTGALAVNLTKTKPKTPE